MASGRPAGAVHWAGQVGRGEQRIEPSTADGELEQPSRARSSGRGDAQLVAAALGLEWIRFTARRPVASRKVKSARFSKNTLVAAGCRGAGAVR